MKRLLLLGCILFVAVGCNLKKEILFTGRTMGTIYHIKVIAWFHKDLSSLEEAIAGRLQTINQSMSTYLPDSEISRFNALERTGEKFAVSEDFYHVMAVAQNLHELTGGAWDGTVKPLVDLWGFGNKGEPPDRLPPAQTIKALLARTGFGHIDVSQPGYLIKNSGGVTLNLASIAKGYGVDEVARVVHRAGFEDFLVEIGGEVYAAGVRLDGNPWRVGINRPERGAPVNAVHKVVALKNRAFATSGDYRNYFELDGRFYSHILDPRTGYPVQNGVVSVSVLADNCTLADGLATAVMVLGPEQGVAVMRRLEHVEGLVIVRGAHGDYREYVTPGFRANM